VADELLDRDACFRIGRELRDGSRQVLAHLNEIDGATAEVSTKAETGRACVGRFGRCRGGHTPALPHHLPSEPRAALCTRIIGL
jgi:hypothetical protein